LFQTRDDCCHVSAPVTFEKSVGILDDHPTWVGFFDQSEVLFEEPDKLEVESGSLTGESEPVRCGNACVLARESTDE
jgi:hypothetical protein